MFSEETLFNNDSFRTLLQLSTGEIQSVSEVPYLIDFSLWRNWFKSLMKLISVFDEIDFSLWWNWFQSLTKSISRFGEIDFCLWRNWLQSLSKLSLSQKQSWLLRIGVLFTLSWFRPGSTQYWDKECTPWSTSCVHIECCPRYWTTSYSMNCCRNISTAKTHWNTHTSQTVRYS